MALTNRLLTGSRVIFLNFDLNKLVDYYFFMLSVFKQGVFLFVQILLVGTDSNVSKNLHYGLLR